MPFTDTQVWFPWNTDSFKSRDAYALQQTLLLTTTLMFTGLAVAFAFRCGLFNIGGQGQYIAGSLAAVWVGSTLAGMTHVLHVFLAIAAAGLAGAFLAGIAGFLKATVGAHEVVVTIMLNWIMFYTGQWLLGSGGPLNATRPRRRRRTWPSPASSGRSGASASSRAPTSASSSGSPRSSSTGSSSTARRSGYEVRAVGYSPDAARYGGINVARSYFLAMAIAGTFAGIGGAMDVLGWEYRVAAARSRCRRSASSASPSRCSAATPRSAWASRRCSSARC